MWAQAPVRPAGPLLVAMGTYRSPAVALMPDVTPNPLRSRANAIINLMGAIGGIIYLAVAAVMYPNTKITGLAHVNYQPLFLVVSAVMLVSVAVLFLTVKEPKLAAETRALEAQHRHPLGLGGCDAFDACRVDGAARRASGRGAARDSLVLA